MLERNWMVLAEMRPISEEMSNYVETNLERKETIKMEHIY